MARMSITINDDIYKALDYISDKTGIKKSKLIEMSLLGKKSLEEIELENIIKEVKKENEWHSLEDVRKELKLWINGKYFFLQEVKNI